MSAQPTPEIQRTPLEALLLQIKSTRPSANVRDYLGRALDPPDVKAIESAWATLGMLGAVQGPGQNQAGLSARLTPLGLHLAMIPVDVRLAKVSQLKSSYNSTSPVHPLVRLQMLVLAAIFRCLDPVREARLFTVGSELTSRLADLDDRGASLEQTFLPESNGTARRCEEVRPISFNFPSGAITDDVWPTERASASIRADLIF